MRLRGRFTVWFALAAVVPIAAAAIGTRQVLSDSHREGYERRQQSAESLARQELARVKREVAHGVASMAQPEGYIGGLLVEMQKYGGRLEQPVLGQVLRRLNDQAKLFMGPLDLDLLLVADSDSVVLTAPHYRPAQHEVDRARTDVAARTKGAPFFARERIIDGDHIGLELVVESARTVSRPPYQVTVVGGRIIDRDALAALRQDQAVDARIVDARGTVLVALAGDWAGPARGPLIRIPLDGADRTPVAWIEMAVSQAELETVLRQVTLLSAGLGGAALVVTVLLGLLVSTRMSRDLDELVVGAQAASRGDLDHQVPVRTEDEIGEVAEAFNTMMNDLKESKEKLVIAERVAAWQEIARRLAHEIKNPLTPIQMSVETLRKTRANQHPSFDEIFEESTQTVLEEAARLKRIVSEFSEFARLPKPEKRRMDLNEVVNGAVSLYQGSISVERDLAGNLPPIEADRDQLSQLLLNLLENARDALPEGPGARIRVQTKIVRPGRSVALVVEDSGPGIASEARDRIFTPYYTTKHGSGGTGLGLAIVHRIVSDHGGRIAVTDSNLGGARFVVELPIPGSGGELGASLRG
ncbi:MAG TPA: ATP-binding protein [Kofleriaceae bacterium]|nr:ATP-binding protein [Kofleriaceae bacterium]